MPWPRIVRLFVIYAVVSNVLFLVAYRKQYNAGLVIGTLVGGLLFAAFSALLAKFGYMSPMLMTKEARAEMYRAKADARAARRGTTSSDRSSTKSKTTVTSGDGLGHRDRPTPTSRTNAKNRRTPPRR